MENIIKTLKKTDLTVYGKKLIALKNLPHKYDIIKSGCDFCVVWSEDPMRTFRFKQFTSRDVNVETIGIEIPKPVPANTVVGSMADEFQAQAGDPDMTYADFQFVVIDSTDFEEPRIYRRGTLVAYCKAVMKSGESNKLKNIKDEVFVDVSNVKKYITGEEFASWFVKMKLTDIDFSDGKFWSAFKFPRKDG